MIEREFPSGASEWYSGADRRGFLRLMAASLGLAGLTACTRQPTETSCPTCNRPKKRCPAFRCTTRPPSHRWTDCCRACWWKRTWAARRKWKGNPDHPASLGATSVCSQAAVLDLYDPDRSQNVATRGEISSWPQFQIELCRLLDQQRSSVGAGLRFLSRTVFSPTMIAQREAILAAFPAGALGGIRTRGLWSGANWFGNGFWQPANIYYRLDRANVILALDSDFLSTGSTSVRYARDFIDGRRMRDGNRRMNRLYAVEPSPSMTGGRADHRFTLKAKEIPAFAAQLAAEWACSGYTTEANSPIRPGLARWLRISIRTAALRL